MFTTKNPIKIHSVYSDANIFWQNLNRRELLGFYHYNHLKLVWMPYDVLNLPVLYNAFTKLYIFKLIFVLLCLFSIQTEFMPRVFKWCDIKVWRLQILNRVQLDGEWGPQMQTHVQTDVQWSDLVFKGKQNP